MEIVCRLAGDVFAGLMISEVSGAFPKHTAAPFTGTVSFLCHSVSCVTIVLELRLSLLVSLLQLLGLHPASSSTSLDPSDRLIEMLCKTARSRRKMNHKFMPALCSLDGVDCCSLRVQSSRTPPVSRLAASSYNRLFMKSPTHTNAPLVVLIFPSRITSNKGPHVRKHPVFGLVPNVVQTNKLLPRASLSARPRIADTRRSAW